MYNHHCGSQSSFYSLRTPIYSSQQLFFLVDKRRIPPLKLSTSFKTWFNCLQLMFFDDIFAAFRRYQA